MFSHFGRKDTACYLSLLDKKLTYILKQHFSEQTAPPWNVDVFEERAAEAHQAIESMSAIVGSSKSVQLATSYIVMIGARAKVGDKTSALKYANCLWEVFDALKINRERYLHTFYVALGTCQYFDVLPAPRVTNIADQLLELSGHVANPDDYELFELYSQLQFMRLTSLY